MLPAAIRVLPLSRTSESEAFGSIENAVEFFCSYLPSRNPRGRFNIPSNTKFKRDSLVLFQYMEERNEPKIIAHALLISDGCVYSNDEDGYVGYYVFEPGSINFYHGFVTKREIYEIWQKNLGARARLNLAVSKYDEYMSFLENRGNTKSRCKNVNESK
ncbi:hypothetical protein L0337_33070 [candidate division KSB1 bacterium]|nr:hypothetical protein [candidate division KSB1 bacterium]